jgi:hypothetical protein
MSGKLDQNLENTYFQLLSSHFDDQLLTDLRKHRSLS